MRWSGPWTPPLGEPPFRLFDLVADEEAVIDPELERALKARGYI